MGEIEVIFLDDDKNTVLDHQYVTKGSKVVYKGQPPTKPQENGLSYTFVGWTNEEKLESVEEETILVAKYTVEVLNASKAETALLNASLENASNTPLNATVKVGNKLQEQMKALEKDPRSPSEIVNEVMENGKAEVGQEPTKDAEGR